MDTTKTCKDAPRRMPFRIDRFEDVLSASFDDVIDVRSPAEFAEDHAPGAINLPALSNEERAIVGTIYVQEDRFKARKIGAALLARNAAAHIEGPLRDKPGAWRPLVYCWRGGQRSGAFATILREIGWRVETLAGGYKSYRRAVTRAVRDGPLRHRLILLDGNTGTAKTELLSRLDARGVQTVDLEGMARHRGSVFGAVDAPQPSQKRFEGELAAALARLDPARPVVVEAESNTIGAIHLPPALWTAMRAAPRVQVRAPAAARAAYLVRAYADVVADHAALLERIEALKVRHSREQIADWRALAEAGETERLARELMERHYDPLYARSRRSAGPVVALEGLDGGDLARGAAQIAAAVEALDGGARAAE